MAADQEPGGKNASVSTVDFGAPGSSGDLEPKPGGWSF